MKPVKAVGPGRHFACGGSREGPGRRFRTGRLRRRAYALESSSIATAGAASDVAAGSIRSARAAWLGRPPEDRRALARAFVAKAVLGVPTASSRLWRRRLRARRATYRGARSRAGAKRKPDVGARRGGMSDGGPHAHEQDRLLYRDKAPRPMGSARPRSGPEYVERMSVYSMTK